MPTSELSDALNPYASQARRRQHHQHHHQQQHHQHILQNQQNLYGPDYSSRTQQSVAQQQQQQYQYQYQPVVQPVQQHVPHVSELEMAITEPIPVATAAVAHVVATAPTTTLPHHQLQTPDPSPDPNSNSQVLTDLMHMLLATQKAQEEERQRRITWEQEQETRYALRQADMEVKMVQMLDELKALRSTVKALNEPPLPPTTTNLMNSMGGTNHDDAFLGLEPNSGLVSPPTTILSPALSQLSTGTTRGVHHHPQQHHPFHPATPTSPVIQPTFPHLRPQVSPHPMFIQDSSTPTSTFTPSNPILEHEPDTTSPETPYQEDAHTFQNTLSQAEYTITQDPDPEPPELDPETLDESSDQQEQQPSPRPQSPKPTVHDNDNDNGNKSGKRKKNQKEKQPLKGQGKEKRKEKKKKTKSIPISPADEEDEDEDESSDGNWSDSSSSVERRPRKRRSHHDTRCYTIHHAMRVHILQMMKLDSDKELPDGYVESETPNIPAPSPSSFDLSTPVRFIWNKTTKQSLHNARMKKLITSDLKDHRRSSVYKHVPSSEFSKKLMDAAFEQCFVTLRQKFKSQRDEGVALKMKTREEVKARRARHLSRRKVKLENRSDARIKLPAFGHVIFDGALHQDCMSSEDSELETDPSTQTGEPTTIFRTCGYAWRSKRLLKFYAILDEEFENPNMGNATAMKRKRSTGNNKRERRAGPVREAFSLPPEGVSSWMLSKRWYRDSKAKYPDFEVLMGKLMVSTPENHGEAGGAAAWVGFRELGEESGDEEGNNTGRVDVSVGQPSTYHIQNTHQDSFRVHLHSIDMGISPQQPYPTSPGIFMNYSL